MIKRESVPTMFFRNHWIEVPNVEILKRNRDFVPITMQREAKNFFERILNIKKDHEPVFVNNKEAKGR